MKSRKLTVREARKISRDLGHRYRSLKVSIVLLARDIREAIDKGVPAELGLTVRGWLDEYFEKSIPHLYRQVKQLRLLRNIDIEKLEEMPEGNREILAHLPEGKRTDPITIAEAVNLPPREFKKKYLLAEGSGGPRPDRFGDPINFRGLAHEPVNEMGVVFLFGMIARELGFVVEAVHTPFPDCDAKQKVSTGRWKRVRIEFEFESRNSRDHGHPLEACDVIVCWRHNWPDCPSNLKVIELSSVIKSLPVS
jgi:hypothetical protein